MDSIYYWPKRTQLFSHLINIEAVYLVDNVLTGIHKCKYLIS